MPTVLNETIADFEYLVTGRADYPEITFSGDDFNLVEVIEGDIVAPLFFGAQNTVALIDGFVSGGITAGGAGFAAILIGENGTVGSSEGVETIGLFGTNSNIILNAGVINADITLNQGQNLILNYGQVFGQVRMGAGDDFYINDQPSAVGLGPTRFSDTAGDIFMGSGNDVVLNASITDNVFLGDGNDFYSAITPLSAFDNFSNPNVLVLGEIRGGTGNDTVFAGANDDIVFGQKGNDVLNGHGGDDFLSGGNNRDILRGGNGDDTLNGGNGKDRLLGGNGDDTLLGGNGQDRLAGGRGDDELSGGSGADVFMFLGGRTGDDVITDFRDGDQIQLQQVFRGGPLVTYDLVEEFTTYEDGDAVIDLDGLFAAADLPGRFQGGGSTNTITVLDVGNGGLSVDDFIL